MADVATLSVLLTAKDQASGVLKRVGQNATQLGLSLAKLGAPLTAVAALSLKTFAKFEKSMVRVSAVSNATAEEFKALEAQAKLMGRTTIFTATQSAEALAFMAQAGLSATDAIGGLPSVLQLAAAGGIELANAADIVTNVMAGMQLEISDLARANDVLVTAFTSANTNLQQLGQAFKFVGPVAAAAGLSLEETSAALALMGNAGLQAAMAGTGLRGSITKLLNPSKEAAGVLASLGVSATDSSGELRSLREIVGQFEEVGLSAADAMTIFGQRAGPAMLALVGQGVDALDELTLAMENSGGTAKRIADAQMNTFTGSMAKLKAVVEGVAINIGETLAPAVRDLTKDLEPVIDAIGKWVKNNPELTKGLIGASVALVGIGGAIAALGLILPGVITLVSGLGVALGISTGGLTVIIGLLATFAVAYATNMFGIRDTTDKVFASITKHFDEFFFLFGPAGIAIKGILELKRHWREWLDAITRGLENVLNFLLPFMQAIDNIDNAIQRMFGRKDRFEPLEAFDFASDFVGEGARKAAKGMFELTLAATEAKEAMQGAGDALRFGGASPFSGPQIERAEILGEGDPFARFRAVVVIQELKKAADTLAKATEGAVKPFVDRLAEVPGRLEAWAAGMAAAANRVGTLRDSTKTLNDEIERQRRLADAAANAIRSLGDILKQTSQDINAGRDIRQEGLAAQHRAGGGSVVSFADIANDPNFTGPAPNAPGVGSTPSTNPGLRSGKDVVEIRMDGKKVGEVMGAALKERT